MLAGAPPPQLCATSFSSPLLQRLTEAAEKAKIELSSTTTTNISLPFITATADGPKHIDTSLTRAKFEQLCSDLLERSRIPVEQALKVCAATPKPTPLIVLGDSVPPFPCTT